MEDRITIAARFTIPMESEWRLGIQGDIGGFGISSDFAWQVFPFVGYRFSQVFELGAGRGRALAVLRFLSRRARCSASQ